ncbi:hypothetical protein CVS30_03790 [Arthrobacter psychrolactophilus]|uniref:HTH cro/C1-type domain-containing protein n=1 Tax=Arthrobacter psychrolactophilus TaxID=92442 RepID=A0A2V5IUZ0_9MICC|nr:helix-turn-helix transcriptional regulator [Arthrobacter psychrolactophilus]PYI39791.1 hypothetical protein CVS30_03790 [Arthrobacter psychrolactophilus]
MAASSTPNIDPDEWCQLLAKRIHGLVETSPLSRKDVAAAVGLTPDRMRRKLRGETRLMITDVFAFARVLEIKPSELIAV